MNKLNRLLLIFILIGKTMCDFEALINLLKTVQNEGNSGEGKSDGSFTITESKHFTYEPHRRQTAIHVEVKVIVPNDEVIAFVRPTKRTCETTSSANISEMCNTARQEQTLKTGVHTIRFDASESVKFEVVFMPVMVLECDEYVKDLSVAVGTIIILKNTKKGGRCSLRLPPSVGVDLLEYKKVVASKQCCPDVFMASAQKDGRSVEYSDNVNACLIDDTTDNTFYSRCMDTFLYFRNAKKRDTLMIRVAARHKEFLNDCIPSAMPAVEDMNYVCMPNPYYGF